MSYYQNPLSSYAQGVSQIDSIGDTYRSHKEHIESLNAENEIKTQIEAGGADAGLDASAAGFFGIAAKGGKVIKTTKAAIGKIATNVGKIRTAINSASVSKPPVADDEAGDVEMQMIDVGDGDAGDAADAADAAGGAADAVGDAGDVAGGAADAVGDIAANAAGAVGDAADAVGGIAGIVGDAAGAIGDIGAAAGGAADLGLAGGLEALGGAIDAGAAAAEVGSAGLLTVPAALGGVLGTGLMIAGGVAGIAGAIGTTNSVVGLISPEVNKWEQSKIVEPVENWFDKNIFHKGASVSDALSSSQISAEEQSAALNPVVDSANV